MVFETYTPAFPLAHFIESFIYYKDYNPGHFINRLLPDGNVVLIIDLKEEPKFIYDNESLEKIQSCRHIWFSGIRNNPISIPSGRESEMFIVNFHKGRSYPFVTTPLHELTDKVVEGDLILHKHMPRLRETLLHMRLPHQKFLTAQNHLLQMYQNKLEQNPFVDFSVSTILQSPEASSIGKISDKVGFSHKHFIKIFKEHVGLTPKEFLKIIRFQKAIEEVDRGKHKSWSAVAFDCGYYDQSHFIADFKNFSGFTPNQYLHMEKSFTNYVDIL